MLCHCTTSERQTGQGATVAPGRAGESVGRFGTLLTAALLALAMSGCATQGPTSGDAKKVAAPVVATPPAAEPAAQPAAATAHATRPVLTLPAPTELERETGIQIAHIGSTASGGLVDARFKVLDAAKATALLGNPANTPMLIAGDKPPLMAPHHAMKSSRFAKDQIVIILYPNTRGAVQPGTEVMVQIGSTKLGPVTAQ